VFRDITTKPKIGILLKIVLLEVRTKPHIHNKIHDILINMTFKMAFQTFGKPKKWTLAF
jgi:hypothetical protein